MMNSEESKKDIPYLPRSYGSNSGKPRPAQYPAESSPPDTADLDGDPIADADSSQSAKPTGAHEPPEAEAAHESAADRPGSVREGIDPPLASETPAGAVSVGEPCTQPGPEDQPLPRRSDKQAPTVAVNVVGVRFNYAGKIYHFDAADLELNTGDWVIVKTEKGTGLGRVVMGPCTIEITPSEMESLRKVIRKAGKVDFDQKARCAQKEAQAYDYCLERIEALGLPMKLIAVECFFDGGKYVFYFTAEGRVDFRELVKQLVARFPVRIEMRQIGVRHEAKMTGGLGCCGQELCCARFLSDFRPVSVKMAKNQNLSLNPTKISGVCGRLMCCLAYENEIYEEFKKGMPRVGKSVVTEQGSGMVLKHNPLTRTLQIKLADETIIEMSREEFLNRIGMTVNEQNDEVAANSSENGSDEEPTEELV